jgi:hypothetical protein
METTAQRAVSRLRRTNDRSVLLVHEDHEDNENAENGVVRWSHKASGWLLQKASIPSQALSNAGTFCTIAIRI